MNRRRILVTYDVCNDRRLRKVFKVLNDFGDHVQFSVFLCELNPMERVRLERALGKVIHHTEDQVLLFDLGLANTDVETTVESIGRDSQPQCRTIVV